MEQETISKNGASLKSHTSRRNFLRKVYLMLLTAGVIFCGGNNRLEAQTGIKNDSISPYINFLKNNNFPSAKEYFLSKFETHDIVILSERLHHDMTQYDLILDVVKDDRFKGHIYTEIGHVNLSERFNDFLLNSTFTEEEKERELLNIYRDLSPSFTWGPYNYYHMLSEVWELNKNREPEDKILIFPTDIHFDYDEVHTYRERSIHWRRIYNSRYRDQMMAMSFVRHYEAVKEKKTKALVILNPFHSYTRIPTYLPLPTRPFIHTAGEFIYKTYPAKVFNVHLNSVNIDDLKLSNDGIIDAAFEYTQKDNIGFDLKSTPIGNIKFDLFDFGSWFGAGYDTNINYDYIFDGMIFYKPLREMVIKIGVPNIYTKENEELFLKRVELTMNRTLGNDKEYIDGLFERVNTWPVVVPLGEFYGKRTVEVWDEQIKKWIE